MKFPFYPLVFVMALCLFAACKKDKKDNPELTFERTVYHPLEIAQLESGTLALTDSLYSATIGNTPVQVIRQAGSLVLLMPVLSPGSYSLSVLINDKEYTAPFTMEATPSATAQTVVNEIIQQVTTTTAMVTAFADTLPVDEKNAWSAEVLTLQQWADSVQQQFNNLTPAEQQQCADFLAANQWWLDELHTAVTDLHTTTRSFKTNDDIADYEAQVEDAMIKFRDAKIALVKHIPKIAALTLSGALIGSAFPVVGTAVGAAIGAALAVIKFSNEFADLKTSLVDLLSTSFVPYQNLFGSGKTQSFISFISNEPKQVTMQMEYRSPYSADNTSNVPLVAELVNGLKEIRSSWNTIADKLPSTLYPPRTVAEKSYYRTDLIDVHSKYVTVDDWDPGDFTVNITKQSGYFIFTLVNNTQQTLYPTYRVTYNYPRLGTLVAYGGTSINPYAPGTCPPTVTDIDGNVYDVVSIGGRCWMAENLRTSRFRNGDPIPQFQLDSFFTKSSLQEPGFAYYNDNAADNVPYGKFYNGYAMADGRGVCPVGWHVPSLNEFNALADSLGGKTVAGDKMKTNDWTQPASNATNSSGFTAYAAGIVAFDTCHSRGTDAEFWTTTWPNFPSGDETFTVKLYNTYSDLGIPTMSGNAGNEWNIFGHSIRCVKN